MWSVENVTDQIVSLRMLVWPVSVTVELFVLAELMDSFAMASSKYLRDALNKRKDNQCPYVSISLADLELAKVPLLQESMQN
jgi:hypothetical protein